MRAKCISSILYLKTDYSKTDKRHLLTQIEPGLLEADLEDIDELLLYTFYIIDTKESLSGLRPPCTSDRVIPNSKFSTRGRGKEKQRFPHAICRNTLLFFEKMDRKCFLHVSRSDTQNGKSKNLRFLKGFGAEPHPRFS